MYFVNMCDEEGVGTFRKGNSIPFVNKFKETVKGYVSLKGNQLVVGTDGKNLFEKGITQSNEAYLPKLKSGLTCKEVTETEENPLILVLCDYIEVYDKVPANIKFIHLGDEKILAMLIYGACGFNGIPMQRCNETELANKKAKKLTSKDIKGITRSIDTESDYNYINDAVIQLEIKYSDASAGACVSGKICHEGTEVFNMEKILHHREHVKVIEEKRKQRKLAEEARKEQEALERAQKQEAEQKAKKEELFKQSSEGAKDFLAALGAGR